MHITLRVDGASETDGLDISGADFGGQYSHGILIVQDGYNEMPGEPQSFKLVPVAPILEALNIGADAVHQVSQ